MSIFLKGDFFLRPFLLFQLKVSIFLHVKFIEHFFAGTKLSVHLWLESAVFVLLVLQLFLQSQHVTFLSVRLASSYQVIAYVVSGHRGLHDLLWPFVDRRFSSRNWTSFTSHLTFASVVFSFWLPGKVISVHWKDSVLLVYLQYFVFSEQVVFVQNVSKQSGCFFESVERMHPIEGQVLDCAHDCFDPRDADEAFGVAAEVVPDFWDSFFVLACVFGESHMLEEAGHRFFVDQRFHFNFVVIRDLFEIPQESLENQVLRLLWQGFRRHVLFCVDLSLNLLRVLLPFLSFESILVEWVLNRPDSWGGPWKVRRIRANEWWPLVTRKILLASCHVRAFIDKTLFKTIFVRLATAQRWE